MNHCSNLAKTPAIPLLSRVSISRAPNCPSKPSLPSGRHPQAPKDGSNGFAPQVTPRKALALALSNGSDPLSRVSPSGYHWKPLKVKSLARPKSLLSGFHLMGVRIFSSGTNERAFGSNGGERGSRALPWIAGYRARGGDKGMGKGTEGRSGRSSWEDSAENYFSRNGRKMLQDDRESRSNGNVVEEAVAVEEDDGPIDDPRWDRIRSKYKGFVDRDSRFEKPEVRNWNRQENWGRKTWKEATESTVLKMVGQGVYGVGPVLAALSEGRREFYALYVQEGVELSGNNRKKKDKKGFEKVLKLAESVGLKVVETSKHDLNMVVDNRPHQGLVLDASPLELVNIRELEPVSVEGQKAPVWVALDEVTDPQNLGSIVRSAYYFGVEGVVLCAKNSAPLSGVVSKASAGSLELIELRSCKNMMQFLTASIENGWRVLGGSVSSRALPLNEIEAGVPTILVLGSEGTGLRPLVERSCTELVRIPGNLPIEGFAAKTDEGTEEMDENHSGTELKTFLAVESLNVGVAAGVLLYHLVGSTSPIDAE